jgi:hypothetical protein
MLVGYGVAWGSGAGLWCPGCGVLGGWEGGVGGWFVVMVSAAWSSMPSKLVIYDHRRAAYAERGHESWSYLTTAKTCNGHI